MIQEPKFYEIENLHSMLIVYVEVGLTTVEELNALPAVLQAWRSGSTSSDRTDTFTVFFDPRYEREATVLSISTFLDDKIKARA